MSDVPQTRPFVLPWKDSDDEVVVNVAIGSLRESVLAWLKTERGVHTETLLCSIGALGAGRVVFSVDYPFESADEAASFIDNVPLDDRVRRDVCFHNAERLLRLGSG